HQRDVVRRPERSEPRAGGRVFAGERDVDEIAGHRDVVGRLRLEIGHDAREHLAAMDQVALSPPVHVAGRALAQELAPARRPQRAEMGVRQMRENEHGLPAGSHTIEMSCPRTDLGFTRDRHFKPRRSATPTCAGHPVTSEIAWEISSDADYWIIRLRG